MKNRIKKAMILGLVSAMLVSFAGCSNTASESAGKVSESETSTSGSSIVEEDTGEANLELTEKEDAEKGEWLAAAAVVAVSMSYGDFEFEHIYVGEEEAGFEFTGDGKEIAILVTPMDAERSDAGTRDLYTEDLGYATFDEGADSSAFEGMDEVTMDDLDTLIRQSVLVTVIEH